MKLFSITNLACTNPELIGSGSTFSNNINSELLEVRDGEACYRTWESTMSTEVKQLSESHPEETFIMSWWWVSENRHSILSTHIYHDGECIGDKAKAITCDDGPTRWDSRDEISKRFQDIKIKPYIKIEIV